jgi:lysozyme
MQELEQWIKSYEGLRLDTYIDTNGHCTIGWGHNLEDGITLDEAELIFQNDLKQAMKELEQCSWYVSQPPGVKQALVNMNFNLGITELLEFKVMIKCLESSDYTGAAQAVLNSLWAKQVHQRATDVALTFRAGK